MSPRTGRPQKENAITSRISVRVDGETLCNLESYCAVNSITKGEAVRRALNLLFEVEK